MIASAIVVLLAVAAAAVFGVRKHQLDRQAQQEAAARVAAAIALVKSRLPESAKPEFRGVSARPNVVCGEVNFREGNTASGYRWFAVGPGAPDGILIDRPGKSVAESHCATLIRLYPGKA
jgi:hypothetical protein